MRYADLAKMLRGTTADYSKPPGKDADPKGRARAAMGVFRLSSKWPYRSTSHRTAQRTQTASPRPLTTPTLTTSILNSHHITFTSNSHHINPDLTTSVAGAALGGSP